MKAIRYHTHGSTSAIICDDISLPHPGPGEVRVEVKAAALNGFDPMILQATTSLKNPLPMIPCGDCAGVISEVGEGVEGWQLGDRVSVLPFGDFGMMGETVLGAAREHFCIAQDNLVAIPDAVSFEDAAALPVAYGTAYRMMYERGRVQRGEKVLILGASGGVGCCCIQLAKAIGATVIATARGAEKSAKLAALGADLVIDTQEQDFVSVIREHYGRPVYEGEGGVDVVINYIGGDTWAQSLKVLRNQGRMLTCGATAGFNPPTDIRYIWSFEHTIIGSNGWTKDDQRVLLDMVANGELSPIIHSIKPFSETADAMQELIDRKVFGKSILVSQAWS